jgi:hypothetical protein
MGSVKTLSRGAFFIEHDQSALSAGVYSARLCATSHTAGPWSPQHQHAGPPTALLARAIEKLPNCPDPSLLAKITVEILGPIPVGDVLIEARVVRSGRRVALCEATLTVPGDATPLMRMSGWRIRLLAAPIDLIGSAPDEPPCPGTIRGLSPAWSTGGYLEAIRWEWVEGGFEQPGPAIAWTEMLVDLVAGERPTPLQHLLAVADSASGISAVGSPAAWLFVNTDLTVHIHRAPVGERIWMSGHTLINSAGVGLTTSTLGDSLGSLAAGAQSLFVDERSGHDPA